MGVISSVGRKILAMGVMSIVRVIARMSIMVMLMVMVGVVGCSQLISHICFQKNVR
jgi:hypothetical protein